VNTHLEPPPVQPRGLGCFGKGCLILAIFILFLIVAGAFGIYFGLKTNSAVLRGLYWAQSTNMLASEPSPVPQFETVQENIAASERKWKDFERASHAGQAARVELTADDLNNFIATNRHLHGKAFVAMKNNALRLQASIPLKEFFSRGGYYLNLDAAIETDGPTSLDQPLLGRIVVNGRTLPPDLLDWKFHSRSLSDYATRHRHEVNTFEIRDGKVILDKTGD
jgi:hypothetical protein